MITRTSEFCIWIVNGIPILISRITSISGIMLKIFYTKLFIQRSHFQRFFIGISFISFGLTLFMFAINMKMIIGIYLGCFCSGVGCSLTTLSISGYIKFYPAECYAFYSTGIGFSGLILCAFYFLAQSIGISFLQVGSHVLYIKYLLKSLERD